MPTTTFTVAGDNDDGKCRKSDVVWANVPTGLFEDLSTDLSSMQRSLFAGTYYVSVVFYRFDTSSIPDDRTVTAATLKVYVSAKGDPDVIEYAADFYDFGGEPTVSADWELTSSGDAIATIAASGLTTSAVNNMALTGLSGISKTDFTGIRIAPKTSTVPAGDNFVRFSHYEHATDPPPQLDVTYTDADPTLRSQYLDYDYSR